MASSPLNRKLKKFVVLNSGEWLEQAPAVLGDLVGNVATGTNGMVYARFTNGSVITAWNRIAPLVFDLQVIIGRSKSLPTVWQVIMVRENYLTPATNGAISAHHEQHEFPNQDTVWVDRKQITALTVLVSDEDNFLVQVYGAVVRTKNGMVMIEHTTMDLSPYIPVSGAVYVSVECNEDGGLSLHGGETFLLPTLATFADVPTPEAGFYTIAFILLYDTMTLLSNSDIAIPVPLITDYSGIAGLYVGLTGDQAVAGIKTFSSFPVTPSANPTTDYQVANKKYVDERVDSTPSLVLGLERWNGANGQAAFDCVNITSGVLSFSINGLEEDPAAYTLSDDGTQITLDTGLESASLVTAQTILQAL